MQAVDVVMSTAFSMLYTMLPKAVTLTSAG
jgi:hypothetical protein